MASGNCPTASGSCGGKRKWRRGSGSGDGREHPGDPPTHVLRVGATEDAAFLGVTEGASIVGATEDASFAGVRVRVTAEIKRWIVTVTRKSHDFFVDITTKKLLGNVEMRSKAVTDVAIRKAVAATIHDVARLYADPKLSVEFLNIRKVELWLRKLHPGAEPIIGEGVFAEGKGEDSLDKYVLGKHELDKFVRERPLSTYALGQWPRLEDEEVKALKREMEERGLMFFNVLAKAIDKDLSYCQRKKQDEILPLVEENDSSEKEVQRLLDLIASLEVGKKKDSETIASLEVGKKKDNETIASFKQQAQKDHACITKLLKEKDVKEQRIAFLEDELQKAQGGDLIYLSTPRSPTIGLI